MHSFNHSLRLHQTRMVRNSSLKRVTNAHSTSLLSLRACSVVSVARVSRVFPLQCSCVCVSFVAGSANASPSSASTASSTSSTNEPLDDYEAFVNDSGKLLLLMAILEESKAIGD